MGSRYVLVVQYLGVLKVNLWDYKGNLLPQKGSRLPTLLLRCKAPDVGHFLT